MKVYIPQILDKKEFTDPELVIISIMTLLSEKDGFDMWFCFHSTDIKNILGKYMMGTTLDAEIMNNLHSVFSIARMDEYNWQFKFRRIPNYTYIPTRKSSKPNARVFPRKLTDDRCIGIYCYLLGRYHSDSGLISECPDYLPHTKEKEPMTNVLKSTITFY